MVECDTKEKTPRFLMNRGVMIEYEGLHGYPFIYRRCISFSNRAYMLLRHPGSQRKFLTAAKFLQLPAWIQIIEGKTTAFCRYAGQGDQESDGR